MKIQIRMLVWVGVFFAIILILMGFKYTPSYEGEGGGYDPFIKHRLSLTMIYDEADFNDSSKHVIDDYCLARYGVTIESCRPLLDVEGSKDGQNSIESHLIILCLGLFAGGVVALIWGLIFPKIFQRKLFATHPNTACLTLIAFTAGAVFVVPILLLLGFVELLN